MRRGFGRRRQGLHGDFGPGAPADARDPPLGGGREAPDSSGQHQQGGRPSLEHMDRSERLPLAARRGMAPDLLREQPGDAGYHSPGIQDRGDRQAPGHARARRLLPLAHIRDSRYPRGGAGAKVPAPLRGGQAGGCHRIPFLRQSRAAGRLHGAPVHDPEGDGGFAADRA